MRSRQKRLRLTRMVMISKRCQQFNEFVCLYCCSQTNHSNQRYLSLSGYMFGPRRSRLVGPEDRPRLLRLAQDRPKFLRTASGPTEDRPTFKIHCQDRPIGPRSVSVLVDPGRSCRSRSCRTGTVHHCAVLRESAASVKVYFELISTA